MLAISIRIAAAMVAVVAMWARPSTDNPEACNTVPSCYSDAPSFEVIGPAPPRLAVMFSVVADQATAPCSSQDSIRMSVPVTASGASYAAIRHDADDTCDGHC